MSLELKSYLPLHPLELVNSVVVVEKHSDRLIVLKDRPWLLFYKLGISLLLPLGVGLIYAGLIHKCCFGWYWYWLIVLVGTWLVSGGALMMADIFVTTTWTFDKDTGQATCDKSRPYLCGWLSVLPVSTTAKLRRGHEHQLQLRDIIDVELEARAYLSSQFYRPVLILESGERIPIVQFFRSGYPHPQCDTVIVDALKVFLNVIRPSYDI